MSPQTSSHERYGGGRFVTSPNSDDAMESLAVRMLPIYAVALGLDRKLRPAVEHNLRHIGSPERVPPFLHRLVEPLRAAGAAAQGGSQ